MKILKLSLLLSLLVFTISCSYDADDKLVINNENKSSFNTLEAIGVDSDLYHDLKEIATDQDVPHLYIACIDFI